MAMNDDGHSDPSNEATILYDAGELAAAEAQFRMAANDRVPKVKESAERGLAAIQRKRAQ